VENSIPLFPPIPFDRLWLVYRPQTTAQLQRHLAQLESLAYDIAAHQEAGEQPRWADPDWVARRLVVIEALLRERHAPAGRSS
jgi:hypothetical protein